ncbi:MAG: dihydrolipoyl dehydrogenase [Acidobacteriota bacterium]
MADEKVLVPDIGDVDEVDVVEVLVGPGDTVEVDDSLITLESDKASMEVPSTVAGVVKEVGVAVGDKVGEGALIAVVEAAAPAEATADEPATTEEPSAEELAPPAATPVASASEPATPPPSAPEGDWDTELLVLGAGPGGYTAAFRAADLGLRVTLVERDERLGGVCLNVGCIPSKALLHVAAVIDEAAEMRHHGVAFGAPKIDLERLAGFKNDVVGRLTGGLEQLAKRREVEVVTGEAEFIGPHELRIGGEGGRVVTFGQAVIAAGSRPVELPNFPNDDPRIMDSTGALELADVPGRLLVIGGGIIGLEMATVYASLGSKVTLVELQDGLMTGCDRDLVRPLERRIRERYEDIFLGTLVKELKAQKNGIKATFEGGDGTPQSRLFDRVLVAVGRRPNGGLIGAERAGVAVDERGFISVDSQQRTNVPHIFAIGDLVGEPMLAHKATHEGKVAAEVAAGLKSGFDAQVIPSVAYTDPEVAWVGVTETEARAQGRKLGKGVFPWAASGRSLALGRDEGMTKLLFDPETERIVGAGVVGTNAGDLIGELALAIEMGCDAQDIGLTVHPHPTLSETVAMAAEAFEGTITDLYMPKKQAAKS